MAGRVVLLLTMLLILPMRIAMAMDGRDVPLISHGENRVALVIGNNNYANVTKLQNAVADAKAMRDELKKLGFDVVYRQDANRKEMNKAVDAFTSKIAANTVGMVFYAGHGVQIDSNNYLLPVDIEAQEASDVVHDGVGTGLV